MRGKVGLDIVGQIEHRITPAYAGKRAGHMVSSITNGDHPRICGEKFRAYAMIWQEWGSPPHMRGKADYCQVAKRQSGITPAYAGKRLLNHSDDLITRDHPRVCGEKHDQLSAF